MERPNCKHCGKPAMKKGKQRYGTICQGCRNRKRAKKKQSINDIAKNASEKIGYRSQSVRKMLRDM